MMKRILKEPLLHFLALAVAVFVAYGVSNRFEAGKSDEIVITESRVDRIAAQFGAIWQRPPTSVELKNLIDDYVKEEIFVREALALGLDKDDVIIRRRLRLKMEFLNSAETATLTPTDAELETYLKDNSEKFEVDPAYAFEQVLLSPDRHGEKIDQDAASVLQAPNRRSIWASSATPPCSRASSNLPARRRSAIPLAPRSLTPSTRSRLDNGPGRSSRTSDCIWSGSLSVRPGARPPLPRFAPRSNASGRTRRERRSRSSAWPCC